MSGPAEIVVGVDGSSAAIAAARYAMHLAEESGAPLRLVHCVPAISPIPPLSLLVLDIVVDTGRGLLFDLTSGVRTSAPSVEVRSTLCIGPRGAELVKAATDAGMVVLGRRTRHHGGRLATGTMVAAIAAHTECPVRLVPVDWKPGPAGSEVIVGIKNIDVSADLVRRGFAVAQATGAPLVLLQAWDVAAGYEELVADTDEVTWQHEATARITNSVGTIREEFPDVLFEVRVVRQRAADALVDASRYARLVIVGRHSHRPALGHLGSTARSVLVASECPVEVGPATHPAEPVFDLELEEHGELLK